MVACRVVAVGRRCFFGLGGGGFRLAGGGGGGAGVVAMTVVVSPVEVTSVVVGSVVVVPEVVDAPVVVAIAVVPAASAYVPAENPAAASAAPRQPQSRRRPMQVAYPLLTRAETRAAAQPASNRKRVRAASSLTVVPDRRYGPECLTLPETHLPNAFDLFAFVPYLALNAAGSGLRSVQHALAALVVASC